MTPVTFTVTPVNRNEWTLTSPELPGWHRTATSPIQLGLHLRDGYSHIRAVHRELQRTQAALPPGRVAYLCECSQVISCARSNRSRPVCPDCRTTRHLQPVTSA